MKKKPAKKPGSSHPTPSKHTHSRATESQAEPEYGKGKKQRPTFKKKNARY